MTPFYFGDYDNSQSDGNKNPEYSLIMDFDNSRVILQNNRNQELNQFFFFSSIAGGGNTFESKTFVLSADGISITGSDAGITLSNPGANPTITISTTKRLKLGFFHITGGGRYSIGKSDGTLHNSIGVGSTNTLGSQTKCIDIASGGNGWTGLISAINATTFDITFTQVGSGLAITGQMQLIEG